MVKRLLAVAELLSKGIITDTDNVETDASRKNKKKHSTQNLVYRRERKEYPTRLEDHLCPEIVIKPGQQHRRNQAGPFTCEQAVTKTRNPNYHERDSGLLLRKTC
jgi:hypothetical protein